MYQHKEQAHVLNQDYPLKETLALLSGTKDKESKEGGWEFCSQTCMIEPAQVLGGIGRIIWILSYRRPLDPADCRPFHPPLNVEELDQK